MKQGLNDKEKIDLGKKLKLLRRSCGYSQQQVADALMIDRSTYAYYETGKSSPDVCRLSKIIKVLNTSYDELFEPLNDASTNLKYKSKQVEMHQKRSKIENQIVIYFRLMSPEEQQKLMDELARNHNAQKDEM